MKFLIQCCHANDYVLEDAWKTIDELSTIDSFSEWIESPSAELAVGTMVRIYNMATEEQARTYLVAQSNYIPMGPYSDVLRNFPWHMSESSHEFSRTHGWPEAWRCCHNGSWMINAALNLCDIKYLQRAMVESLDSVLDKVYLDRFNIFIEIMRKYTYGNCTLDTLRAHSIHSYDFRNTETYFEFAQAAMYLYESANTSRQRIEYVSSHIASVAAAYSLELPDEQMKKLYDEEQRKIADTIRRLVPMHDIMMKMVSG